MTEIAKAYVQIVPSMKGVKSNLDQEFNGAAESSGNSFGNKFAAVATKIIAAAGIGKVISDSISAGADLQQSIGGIETLFGSAADQMKAYASEAYQTAGISANEYMEQATSFAASLISSMEGDVAGAAEIANQAMIDMSDNSNKMGTSIESIQNAYQGFAKQNYTMLDNLKLGYGGTKEEMERLLADAEKLTGVKYDISSLDDVYNAIHAIQENLGITGTTAAEASETFSGSLNAMKAAFSDLQANMALGLPLNLGPMTETITAFVSNAIPMLTSVLGQLPGAFLGLVTALAPTLMSSGADMINSIISGLSASLPMLIPEAANILVTITQGIVQNLPTLISSGMDLIGGIIDGLMEALPILINAAPEIVTAICQGLLEHGPELMTAGVDLFVNLIGSMPEIITEIIEAIPEIVNQMVNTFAELLPEMKEAGKNLLEGLWQGISDTVGSVIESVRGAGRRIIDNFKSVLGIASPSKVFAGIGGYMMEGLSEGIVNNENMVQSAMNGVNDMLTGSLNMGVSADSIQEATVTSAGATAAPDAEPAPAGGNFVTDVQVNFTGSLAQLATILQPYITAETHRRGISLINS